MSWFTDLFGKKEDPTPESLSAMFVDSVKEVHAEQRKLERELNDNAKLSKLIRKTIRAMVDEEAKGDTYSFIHVHHFQIGVKETVFQVYARIFSGVAKELGLPVEIEKGYIRVQKRDLREAFEKLRSSEVDIDERTRAMLSQGIYR
jgi:hypothetical protein